MADVQGQIDYPRGLTFEQVWANINRLAESQKEFTESQKELAESQKEFIESQKKLQKELTESQRELKESQKETDRQIKDINKRFGEYSNRLGEISEYMIAPNLREKFNELGYDFQKTSKNTEVADHHNNIIFEIDYFLENYNKAMLVEVKTKLISDHVNAHIERLKKMRKYADLHGDKRSFLGAVAGVVIPDEIKKIALNQGLFVLEPSGETFKITPPNGNPKEW